MDTDLDHLDEHDDHDHEEHEEHDEHDEHGSEVDVETLKIILMVCMILVVGLGFIPKMWGRCRTNDTLLSLLNSFSAGIFLAMAIIHMMPESAEIYNSWATCKCIENPFPLPYVMYFVGYMVILSIDRVLARAYHNNHSHNGD